MLGSIYAGLSGLLGFSKGLDVLSNNVANMNSPGFKSSELAFRDLLYRQGLGTGSGEGNQSSLRIGSGVDTDATRIRFSQGEMRETGGELDVAIDGIGFFVLRKDGETFYTRAGQFEFNEDNILVERSSGARVAALNGGQLQDITLDERLVRPFRQTANVFMEGNLNLSATAPVTVSDILVQDAAGITRTLSMVLTNTTAGGNVTWSVEVREGTTALAVIGTPIIGYAANGSPTTSNTVQFTLPSVNGVPASNIIVNFGTPGSLAGSTSMNRPASLAVGRQDGATVGSVVEKTFDANGFLTVTYSNGDEERYERAALAWFGDLQQLVQVGKNLFANETNQAVMHDVPGTGSLGKLAPKKIELSNVELTEQFTDMVVIQRGYQASSQIVSVSNEMIQQLLDIRARR